MKKNFNNFSFFELFLAELVNNHQLLIDFVQLGPRLYEFSQMKEYQNLFIDFKRKKQIKKETIDMSEVLEKAIKLQYLGINCIPENSNNLIIKIPYLWIKIILQNANPNIVLQMEELVTIYLEKYHNRNIKIKQLINR